jgi:hypothetical protein
VGKFFAVSTDGETLSQKRLAHELERARLVGVSAQEKARKGGRASAAKRKQLQLGLEPQAPPGVEPEVQPQVQPGAQPQVLLDDLSPGDLIPDSGHSAGPFSHSGLVSLFSAIWTEQYRETYMGTPSDQSNLGRLLRSFPDRAAIAAYPWEFSWRAYLADQTKWLAEEQRHSLAWWCTSGGVNKYRTQAKTVGYSDRELRGMQSSETFDKALDALEGGKNGRTR